VGSEVLQAMRGLLLTLLHAPEEVGYRLLHIVSINQATPRHDLETRNITTHSRKNLSVTLFIDILLFLLKANVECLTKESALNL
jgi:hypothetical protein